MQILKIEIQTGLLYWNIKCVILKIRIFLFKIHLIYIFLFFVCIIIFYKIIKK